MQRAHWSLASNPTEVVEDEELSDTAFVSDAPRSRRSSVGSMRSMSSGGPLPLDTPVASDDEAISPQQDMNDPQPDGEDSIFDDPKGRYYAPAPVHDDYSNIDVHHDLDSDQSSDLVRSLL